MSLVKLLAFADNDTTSDAENVLKAMMKETDVSQYLFIGDGPYAKSGTKWTSMMSKYFDDVKKKLLMISRGNHDEDESESKQTQKDIEAWYPELKSLGISDTWLSSKQVGNVYIINMDTQDLEVEFERDQFNWVKSELVKAKQLRSSGQIDWIIVLFHKPFFTEKSSHSPYTAVRFLYKDVFRDAQVDFCISGHNHNTQLWLPMVPNQSKANGEGDQKFSMAADGKTFDFTKDHGAFFIVTGHAGHEWNSISEQNKNVMYHRSSGKFGYTSLEIDGKKVKVMAKDTDNQSLYEYNVTREGGIIDPPIGCPSGQCKDPNTNQCRAIAADEEIDSNGFCKKKDIPDPDGEIVCPEGGWEYDPSLGHCIPPLTPEIKGPQCKAGYTWDPVKKICVKDGTNPPPPCKDNECKDPTTQQCRPIGTNEIKDSQGFCRPKPVEGCPTGQCKDPVTNQCRNLAADEEIDSNGFCKKKVIIDPGEGEVDENGIIWFLPEVKGKKTTIVKQSRDEADDDRWSENVPGCEDGFEQTMIAKSIGIASDGHFASKLGGSNHSKGDWKSERWMDLGVRSNGDVQLQWEGPHPSNHDFSLPDDKLFIKNIGVKLEGNWVGLKWAQNILKKGGSPANGGVRWRMWCNTDIASDGKPDNTKWRLVLDFIDGVDVKVIEPQDFRMKGTMDVEVRRSGTKNHEVYGGGLMIRPFK